MVRASSVVAGRELAVRLKRRRTDQGLDIQAVSRQLGVTRNYWSLVENERRTPTNDKLEQVIGVLGFSKSEGQELLGLRALAVSPGWWSEHVGAVGPELQQFYGLEYGAERIRSYESSIVNGVLQTRGYATEIIQAALTVRPTDVRGLVEVRMERQEQLLAGDVVEIIAVMNEAALLQQVGTAAVLRGQLLHLVDLIENRSETIRIRIKPFTSPYVSGGATIYLLDFASEHLPTIAWEESISLGALQDDPVAVNSLELNHEIALQSSLDQEASHDLISEYASKLA